MKNKLNLQAHPPKNNERKYLNKRDAASFIVGAEEDYILTRILLWTEINSSGMYHYQQTVEKYLKAYLVQKGLKFKDTHDLVKLSNLASKYDKFFSDKEYIEACRLLTYFEEIGRYPQEKIRGYGWTFPDVLYFLDEFMFDMRKRIDHKGIRDELEKLKSGKLGMSIFVPKIPELIELFYKDNHYFSK